MLAERLTDPTGAAAPGGDAPRRVRPRAGVRGPPRSARDRRVRRAAHRAGAPGSRPTTCRSAWSTGHRGVRRFRLNFVGQPDHAGTTPMDRRKDAFLTAAEYATKSRELVVKGGQGRAVTTIGVVDVRPGVPNIVPERAMLLQELRDPDPTLLESLTTRTLQAARRVARQRGLVLEVEHLMRAEPVRMSGRIQGRDRGRGHGARAPDPAHALRRGPRRPDPGGGDRGGHDLRAEPGGPEPPPGRVDRLAKPWSRVQTCSSARCSASRASDGPSSGSAAVRLSERGYAGPPGSAHAAKAPVRLPPRRGSGNIARPKTLPGARPVRGGRNERRGGRDGIRGTGDGGGLRRPRERRRLRGQGRCQDRRRSEPGGMPIYKPGLEGCGRRGTSADGRLHVHHRPGRRRAPVGHSLHRRRHPFQGHRGVGPQRGRGGGATGSPSPSTATRSSSTSPRCRSGPGTWCGPSSSGTGAAPSTSTSCPTPSSCGKAWRSRTRSAPTGSSIGAPEPAGGDDTARALRAPRAADDHHQHVLRQRSSSTRRTPSSSPRSRSSTRSPTSASSPGGDVTQVMKGMGLDPRIGAAFLQRGPRVRGLVLPEGHRRAHPDRGRARLRAPHAPRRWSRSTASGSSGLVALIRKVLDPLDGRVIAVLGLAFKPKTDDMREARSVELIARLVEAAAPRCGPTTRSRWTTRGAPCRRASSTASPPTRRPRARTRW